MQQIQTSNPAVRLTSSDGEGYVEITQVAGKSAVTRSRATSPLKLLSPRSPGGAAWIFASTYGGGLVSGDSIRLNLQAGPNTRCVLSTQASTKVYRALEAGCRQELNANIAAGALVVCAPDPVVCYKGAEFTQRQRFSLDVNASLIFVDWFTSGRWACGERWAFSQYSSRNEIFVEDRCVFRDILLLDPIDGPLDGPMRMGSINCFATVVLVGPTLKENVEQLLQFISTQPAPSHGSLLFSASPIENGAILRVAGESCETVGSWIHERLAFVVALVGQDPWERKW
jgi:urease accessory protein